MDNDTFKRIAEEIKPPIELLSSAKYSTDIKEYLKDTGVAIEQLKPPTRLEKIRRYLRDLPSQISGGIKECLKKKK